jgi:hypothetical protein
MSLLIRILKQTTRRQALKKHSILIELLVMVMLLEFLKSQRKVARRTSRDRHLENINKTNLLFFLLIKREERTPNELYWTFLRIHCFRRSAFYSKVFKKTGQEKMIIFPNTKSKQQYLKRLSSSGADIFCTIFLKMPKVNIYDKYTHDTGTW